MLFKHCSKNPIVIRQQACLKHIFLLPWINIAIVTKRISNVDLSTINIFVGRIFTDGDCHCADFMCLQKVQSPPRIQLTLCGATGPIVDVGVIVSINGFVATGTFILTGLSGYSPLCNVCFWKVFKEVSLFLRH